MTAITLTSDQDKAMQAVFAFLANPTEPVFVLSGYSGTGKSTLVKTILERYGAHEKTVRLIDPTYQPKEIILTATTNKAAEALSELVGQQAVTIQSFLELKVVSDYTTNTTTLEPRTLTPKEGLTIFIDEASYVDRKLLSLITQLTHNCKLIFIGDPAQLTPVKNTNTPVFHAGFPEARLSEVVRQKGGNPIIDLATRFRETVTSGQFFSFAPDGYHVTHMERTDFNQAIAYEMGQDTWRHNTSKVLAWTNKRAVAYNQYVRDSVKGSPDFHAGDFAICNKYMRLGSSSIKTDQTVQITQVSAPTTEYGVAGKHYTLNDMVTVFGPDSLSERNSRITSARQQEDFKLVQTIENTWIDLRAQHACTINKAQGSTYDKVFIDLDDISRCNSGELIARMMYVGVSRAREHVILTGDLV